LFASFSADGPSGATFGDYRNVDGEFVPCRTTVRDSLGETTVEVREVRFNEEMPPGAFAAGNG
jgi:hypothetical protein